MMNVTAARTIDLGNNETRTIGIVADRFAATTRKSVVSVRHRADGRDDERQHAQADSLPSHVSLGAGGSGGIGAGVRNDWTSLSSRSM